MKNTSHIILASLALILSACGDNTNHTELINTKASLPPSFNFPKLGLKVISSSINKKQGTMSTLYGNAQALNNAETDNKVIVPYEILALVTWKQQSDEHWFGANIPGDLQTVEMIKTTPGGPGTSINYQRFKGKNLNFNTDTLGRQARIKYIFDLKPSIMP
jgi:hypothetical protein